MVAERLSVASRRVEDPAEIKPALKEAIEITEKGAPYLLEIITKEGHDFSRYQEHTS